MNKLLQIHPNQRAVIEEINKSGGIEKLDAFLWRKSKALDLKSKISLQVLAQEFTNVYLYPIDQTRFSFQTLKALTEAGEVIRHLNKTEDALYWEFIQIQLEALKSIND